MSFVPGLGLAKGMALTLRRFFEPKVTIMYPEVRADLAPKFRGRLQLLYDEYGTLKCETCFQCAQACPIECIDMGGIDTKGRFHVHWGPPETYGERREESALRRSGRTVAEARSRRQEGLRVSSRRESVERGSPSASAAASAVPALGRRSATDRRRASVPVKSAPVELRSGQASAVRRALDRGRRRR